MKELQTRLEVLRDVLKEKITVAKKKLKEDYVQKSKLRKCNPGDMVLVRMAGLSENLEDSWNGPYEVQKHLNEVTYTLIVPNFRGKVRTLHTTNLIPCVERTVKSSENSSTGRGDNGFKGSLGISWRLFTTGRTG